MTKAKVTMMRNRWGIEIRKGYHVFAHHPRGGMIEGKAQVIDREPGRGYVVTLDNGYTVAADDVSEVLPPMRVGRGGVVKANPAEIHIDIGSHNTKGRNVRAKNPVTEARELFLFAQNEWSTYQKIKRALSGDPTMPWLKVAEHAARDYSSEFGNGASKWREIFTADDVRAVASMLRSHYEELEGDDIPEMNPTPRLTRYDQPSQRERISERTGRATKTPSARLKNRRLKTHHFAPEGVWANPVISQEARNSAFEMARKFGIGPALAKCEAARDKSSPGTMSFALHNEVCRALREMQETGAGFRTFNPITRVKLKSPAQRSGADPSPRLLKRRRVTAKAPPGFYANPITGAPGPFLIEKKVGSRWVVIGTAATREQAFLSAMARHKAHPNLTLRVWDSRT